MRSAITLLLLLILVEAWSAPPPFGTWLRIRVTSCQPVTFEAPDNAASAKAQRYAYGEKLRVTLIAGEIVKAENFTQAGKWEFSFPPPAKQLVGQHYVGFLPEGSSSSCPSDVPGEVDYVRVWGCDTEWRRGDCLPPFPQLQKVQANETFRFVGQERP